MSGSHSVATSKATMSDSQIALWREHLENPPPKPKTIPGPAMTLKGSRKHHPKAPEKPIGACVHRWRIAEQNGPISPATCSLCGEAKEMKNVFVGDQTAETRAWDSGGKRWRDPKRTPKAER